MKLSNEEFTAPPLTKPLCPFLPFPVLQFAPNNMYFQVLDELTKLFTISHYLLINSMVGQRRRIAAFFDQKSLWYRI